jgi:hypothetical protein
VRSRRSRADASRHSNPNPRPFNHLQPLSLCFPTPVLCFQQLAASFPKTPGWGVPFGARRTSNLQSLTSVSAVSTFRINTCKSGSKQRTLTTFRMNTYAKRGEGGPLRLTTLSAPGDAFEGTVKEEARAKTAPAPHFQASCLLSASGTGSTTIGGSAARSSRCVYRRGEAECDHGDQQNCSDSLHDFLLFGMKELLSTDSLLSERKERTVLDDSRSAGRGS